MRNRRRCEAAPAGPTRERQPKRAMTAAQGRQRALDRRVEPPGIDAEPERAGMCREPGEMRGAPDHAPAQHERCIEDAVREQQTAVGRIERNRPFDPTRRMPSGVKPRMRARSSQNEEVAQQRQAGRGQHRFRVELHAPDRQAAVRQRHDLALGRAGVDG